MNNMCILVIYQNTFVSKSAILKTNFIKCKQGYILLKSYRYRLHFAKELQWYF